MILLHIIGYILTFIVTMLFVVFPLIKYLYFGIRYGKVFTYADYLIYSCEILDLKRRGLYED